MHLSTLSLGQWWEDGDIVDVLHTLHFELGMPRERLTTDIIVDTSDPTVDWRMVEKNKSGLANESSIWDPLVFKKEDPPWVQHWILNALGTSIQLFTHECTLLYRVQLHSSPCQWNTIQQ